jgi:hypothetical protein
MTLASVADVYTRRGDFAAAIAHFEESVELHGQLGVHSSEAYLRASMAALRRHVDGPEVARAQLRAFAEDVRQSARDVSHAMLELGHLACADGDIGEAERLYVEAWRLQERTPIVAVQGDRSGGPRGGRHRPRRARSGAGPAGRGDGDGAAGAGHAGGRPTRGHARRPDPAAR